MAAQDTQNEGKQKKNNTICVGYHYTQTNINNVNKTQALLQTTGGKDERRYYVEIVTDSTELGTQTLNRTTQN